MLTIGSKVMLCDGPLLKGGAMFIRLRFFVFSVYSLTPFFLDDNDLSGILSQVSPQSPFGYSMGNLDWVVYSQL